MATTGNLPSDPLPIVLQQDEISEECKALLPSLTSESWGWISPELYQYQGFWLSPKALHGVLSVQKHFKANDSDIIIVTQPKSGTTWIKALVYALINRAKYPIPCRNHPLLFKNPHDLVLSLELQVYSGLGLPDMSNFTSPRLFSTHMPSASLPKSIHDADCKLIYLCRNPKDTFVSLWHFSNKMMPEQAKSIEEAFDLFQRGLTTYGPYWEHVLDYWKESLKRSKNVMFLKYENIQEQPRVVLKKMAQFLGHPFSQEEELVGTIDQLLDFCSFEKLSNLDVNKIEKINVGLDSKLFFRRGKVGDWTNYLSFEMIERLDQITEQKFCNFGLAF